MGRYRTVEVYVRPDAKKDNGYYFWMEEKKGVPEQRLVFDKDVDGVKKKDNYYVDFKLNNEDGANLRFSQKIDQVLWAKAIQPGEKCPETPCYMPGVFFVEEQDDIAPKKLRVKNTDMDCVTFAFALNFVREDDRDEPPGTPYICYDPIGENRNGGSVRSIHKTLAVGVALAGAAALAFLFGRMWK